MTDKQELAAWRKLEGQLLAPIGLLTGVASLAIIACLLLGDAPAHSQPTNMEVQLIVSGSANPQWIDYTCRSTIRACIDLTERHLDECAPAVPPKMLAIATGFAKSGNPDRKALGAWVLRYQSTRSSTGCLAVRVRP